MTWVWQPQGSPTNFVWPQSRIVLAEFDGPVMVLCVAADHSISIGVAVDENREEKLTRWLVAPLTARQVAALVKSEPVLRSLFAQAQVHIVDQANFDHVAVAWRLPGVAIPDSLLPDIDAVLPAQAPEARAALEGLLPSPTAPLELTPGVRVSHPEFGEGVVIAAARDGYARVFFSAGERVAAVGTLQPYATRAERIIANVHGTPERVREAWLEYEAHALPLMESAAALTAAPIDLLPHQVVLTHRIATASPRRFLVADEVGLGKTIETALLLRELASRGELKRALMVVPAGLVNNWHREMNEVFRLDFEVFGSVAAQGG